MKGEVIYSFIQLRLHVQPHDWSIMGPAARLDLVGPITEMISRRLRGADEISITSSRIVATVNVPVDVPIEQINGKAAALIQALDELYYAWRKKQVSQ